MKHSLPFTIAVSLIGFLGLFAVWQEPTQPANEGGQPEELAKRVETLEKRVAVLERILFTTSKLATQEAERQYEEAERNLKQSEQLFRRGLLTQAQLAQDRFVRDLAQQEVEFAQEQNRLEESAAELDLLQAKQTLAEAEQQLEFTKRLFAKGFVTRNQLNQRRRTVETAKRRLNLAKDKSAAAKELFDKGKK